MTVIRILPPLSFGVWPWLSTACVTLRHALDRPLRRQDVGGSAALTMQAGSLAGQSRADARLPAADAARRFHETIVPFLDASYNFARFLSRDADAAEDIVQEAFLRAYRHFDGYRGGDPRAWLFSIVRNCYRAWLQDRRRKARFEQAMPDDLPGADEPAHEFAADGDTPEMAMIHASDAERVRAVIAGLPEAMREILVLRELEDLSYRQIAEIIGAPIGTVMSRLARSREEFGKAWRLIDPDEAKP